MQISHIFGFTFCFIFNHFSAKQWKWSKNEAENESKMVQKWLPWTTLLLITSDQGKKTKKSFAPHPRYIYCYDFEQLLDSSLYLCSVLGRLSIVYSHLLGSRFNLSSLRMPLVSGIVQEVWERSCVVNKLSSSYWTWLVTVMTYEQ